MPNRLPWTMLVSKEALCTQQTLTAISLEDGTWPAQEGGIGNTTAQPAEGGKEMSDRLFFVYFDLLLFTNPRATCLYLFTSFTCLHVRCPLTRFPPSCLTTPATAKLKAPKLGTTHLLLLSYLTHCSALS
jgi:hypothetical protein